MALVVGDDSRQPAAAARKLQLIQFKILSDCNEEEEDVWSDCVRVCVTMRQATNVHVSMSSRV